jgi:8-oxo-dGTP pyrophosphatase MutT (NUDIX family)
VKETKPKDSTKPKDGTKPKDSTKPKAYAGVLPWTIDPKGRLWILLGRESDGPEAGKWSDFGGGVEAKDHSTLEAAFREMNEESMGLLKPPESKAGGVDSICPSLTFDFGSFHGSLILGLLGSPEKRLSKKQWDHLRRIPRLLGEIRRARPCIRSFGGAKAHDATCEKDRARWIRIKDIRGVEPSMLLVEGETARERVILLRKSYGLLLRQALKLLNALQGFR